MGPIVGYYKLFPQKYCQIVSYRDDGVAERQEEEPQQGVEGGF